MLEPDIVNKIPEIMLKSKINDSIIENPPTSPRSVIPSSVDGDPTLNAGCGIASSAAAGKNAPLFPWKLHEMLRSTASEGRDNIVSWLPHGTAFKVHNVPDFVSTILPLFFKQTKYKSFQRQLNLWGFERIQTGPEKGAYYHKQFIREDQSLCRHLTRQRASKRISCTGSTAADGGAAAVSSTPPRTTSICVPPSPPTIAVSKHVKAPPRMTTASSFSKKKPSLTAVRRKLQPTSRSLIPRTVSEISLSDGFQDPILDIADFEGFTFHLLEQERCEELNLEFKFTPPASEKRNASSSSSQLRHDAQISTLLKELEQGVFGVPKMAFDAFDAKQIAQPSC